MGSILFEHNRKAYMAAVEMMEKTGRAAIIHPTGTGKSFLAFQLAADNAESRVCLLSPSEYIFATQMEKWILAGGRELPNIQFITYARLMRMEEDELAGVMPDCIVLDEFHRCGAAQWGAGVKRLREMYPEAKVLGLSATNIRYLDNQRDMAWELFGGNVASELTLGAAVACGILPAPKYVLSVYSYRKELQRYEMRVRQTRNKAVRDQAEKELEALRRALEKADGLEEVFARHMLPKTESTKTEKHILSRTDSIKNAESIDGMKPEWKEKHSDDAVSAKDIENLCDDKSRKTLKSADITASAMPGQGCGKYIVFCASYEHLLEMRELAPEWFRKVDAAPHIYTAYSDDPATSAEFAAFKADTSVHLKLLYCIDMLNEGIHVDGVDGVILLRPTVSPTIYKQQIGRALASGGKKAPVIFDIVMNIENLYSIGAIEEELREAVFAYRVGGRGGEIVHEHFRIIDELGDCRRLFAQLNETLGASWEAMYAMAQEYYAAHGNLEVPKRYTTSEGYSLGAWIDTQRKVYAGKVAGNLREEQIRKLSAIGMRWQGARELAWEKHYAEAVQYYKEHGNLLVGMDGQEVGEKDEALFRWLAGLRTAKKKAEGRKNRNGAGMLTKERIAALDALGMVWDDAAYVWERHYAAAERYYKEHGDLEAASYYVDADGFPLGKWIARQRKQKNALAQGQIERLSAIGMRWKGRNQDAWEKSYVVACEYFRAHGDLNVPATYVTADGCHLGRWVRAQRDAYHLYHLKNGKNGGETFGQKEENGGETFGQKEEMLENAAPKDQKKEALRQQGNRQKKRHFDAERKKRLDAIGMVWENGDSWERRFALAKQYYEEHGNLEMPADYVVEGVWLARWLREQRARLAALESMGFVAQEDVGFIAQESETSVVQTDAGFAVQENIKSTEDENTEFARQKNIKSTGKKDVHVQDKIPNFGSEGATTKEIKPLSAEQAEKLYSIGISLGMTKTEISWRQQYGEAEEFYRKHGNLVIPKRYTAGNGKKLGVWLQHQRMNRRSGQLSGWQVMMLDGIGMVWEFDDPWENGLRHAKEYLKEHGNLAVPNQYVCADGYRLGKWISNQRCAYGGVAHKGLTEEQVQELERIGMVWSAKVGRRAGKR